MNTELKVLIVDDEPELRKSILFVLQNQLDDYNFSISDASNGAEAVRHIHEEGHDVVLMDVRMPEMDGLEALKEIRRISPKTSVLIMTAHSNLQDAVIAIKNGAFDYIEKPVQPATLKKVMTQALNTREIVSQLAFSKLVFDDDNETKFVGSSQKMNEVFDLIHRLSHVDTTVLVRGENGTGKELVARAIHQSSPRKQGELITINCGAIPENLMESELFGHEKGAFTGATERKIGRFQLANKGTIFLDEIGELRPDMQVKLLRVLQERKFTPVGGQREIKTNARIIAATNRNLEKMIEEHTFREDLFYRLNVMPIFMPPLRERTDDIESLVQYFIRKFSKQHKRKIISIDEDALACLKSYNWPGNIRELENVIERAFIVENQDSISLSSIPDHILQQQLQKRVRIPLQPDYSGPMDFDRFKEETEKDFIIRALKTNEGKINKTVLQANIPKNTLLRKIKKYQIDVKNLFN